MPSGTAIAVAARAATSESLLIGDLLELESIAMTATAPTVNYTSLTQECPRWIIKFS
jgi:hypothetical protein